MPKVTKDKTAMIIRGNILCTLRKERNINQTVVAECLGITQQAYLKYEHGDADPTIDALIKLSDFYDVSIDYLLGLTDVQTIFHHEKLEENLKNAYLSLPRNIRADILEAMVNAVLNYQHGETLEWSNTNATVQRQSVSETNNAEQLESTQQPITQKKPSAEHPAIPDQKPIVKPKAAARQGEVPHLEDDAYWDEVDRMFPDTDPSEFNP